MELQKAFDQVLNRLGPFEAEAHLAIAVSGGSDSLALALLALEWSKRYQGTLTGLIVDHGLRDESTQEALHVQQQLLAFGISAEILIWEGLKPLNRLQENARRARYHLLQQWCAAHHVLHLLVGHHQDDQRETFQLRHTKNSGPSGLSGMSTLIETPGVRILRPLLNFSKVTLRAYLQARSIPYIEDPSNTNLKYSRTALRQNPLTEEENQKLLETCQRFGLSRVQEETRLNLIMSHCVEAFKEGYGILNLSFFNTLLEPERILVFQRCLMTFGVGEYVPARESIKHLYKHLGKTQTLHGCLVFSHREQIYFSRELGQIKKIPLNSFSGKLYWDNRFIFSYDGIDSHHSVGPLGEQGWSQLKRCNQASNEVNAVKKLPPFVRFAQPALWCGETCLKILIPDNMLDNSSRATLTSEFTKKKEYAIYFAPRYPLTRFSFMIV